MFITAIRRNEIAHSITRARRNNASILQILLIGLLWMLSARNAAMAADPSVIPANTAEVDGGALKVTGGTQGGDSFVQPDRCRTIDEIHSSSRRRYAGDSLRVDVCGNDQRDG